MVLYCQSSSVSLLITTLAVCSTWRLMSITTNLYPHVLLQISFFPVADIDLKSAEKKFKSAITACSHSVLLNLLSCHR